MSFLAALLPVAAHGFEIATEEPGFRLRWDNTLAYGAAWRLNPADARLTADRNQDDGDRSFARGLIQNRADLLSEFEVKHGDFGVRASGAAWFDTIYSQGSDDHEAGSFNPVSVPAGRFAQGVRNLHGRRAELLDAFIFGKVDVVGRPASFRAGRHTVIYGESLFFGSNAIASGQAPVDLVKARQLPNARFSELIRPVTQLSGQVQLSPTVSVGAYYQLEWQKTRLPAAGSYFSVSDSLDAGGERLFTGTNQQALFRSGDQAAHNSGQFGAELRFRIDDVDYGLYGQRYHDKTPQVYLRPGTNVDARLGKVGEYNLVYPEGIQAYGASAATDVGPVSLAIEASFRHDMPLVSTPQTVAAGATADNADHARYAVGNSAHAQLSWLYELPPNFLAHEAQWAGEIAWNRRLGVTRNRAALDPNATREAMAVRMVVTPTYRQVLPGLDLSVPVGLGYAPWGRSSVVQGFGVEHGGDLSIGLDATYLEDLRVGLSYTHYFGPPGTNVDSARRQSFKQSLADRDFIAFSLRRSF